MQPRRVHGRFFVLPEFYGSDLPLRADLRRLYFDRMTNCRNCDTPLEASFCPNCVEKDLDLERPLPDLLGEVLRENFDVDGRAFRTLWTLFRRPGVLTSEFLAGKRKLYTPPFRLYLVISVLFFIVAGWVVGQGALLTEGRTVAADAAGQARFVSDDLPRLMFVLLPVFALFLKAAFRQRLYFDHLIHSLHLHSAAYILLAFLLPLEQAADRHWLPLALQLLLLFLLLSNFVISVGRVYQVNRRVAGIRALVVMLGYIALVGAASDLVSHITSPGAQELPFREQ